MSSLIKRMGAGRPWIKFCTRQCESGSAAKARASLHEKHQIVLTKCNSSLHFCYFDQMSIIEKLTFENSSSFLKNI